MRVPLITGSPPTTPGTRAIRGNAAGLEVVIALHHRRAIACDGPWMHPSVASPPDPSQRPRAVAAWRLTMPLCFLIQGRGITEALAADQHFIQAGVRALLRGP
jgi:hypothetical protein